jgi:SAM-dependent methyltransferase
MKRGRPSTGPHEAGAGGATESHPCGPPSERLHPGIGDRNYLHLAPIAQILGEAIRTTLRGDRLRVLDLGCGAKPYAPLLMSRCASYVGVDIQLPSSADVLAAGERLPFRSGSFDVVLCTQVLEHDPEPQQTVAEAHRVLSSGGTLLLSTHGVWFKHGEADYWRWTDAGLRRLMRSFPDVEVYSCGGQYSALFQILNLYADPLPFGRRFLYLVNNALGLALDRVLPAENLIVNYVVVAGK